MRRPTTSHLVLSFLSLILLGFANLAVRSVAAADKHPFGLDDYSSLRHARAISISPDGKSILYEVSYDGEKGPTKHEWHLVDSTGENARKLELPDSFEPAGFTKDGGALYGNYEVEKKGQLGIVPLAGGKPTQITALPNGVHGIWISPDGTKFAFTSDPQPADPLVEVRHVAQNSVNSIYVANANNPEGS